LQERLGASGAIPIDARQPIERVAEAILGFDDFDAALA
jgi:hypothetical protein